MATQALDPRIIKVSIEVNGVFRTYTSPLNIKANGSKYANALQNECLVTITNLDRSVQDYLLTETSPYNLNRTPKTLILEVGRESYGTAVIYRGNIVNVIVSQPPDIGTTMKCLTGNFIKGNVSSFNQPGSATVNQIANSISQSIGVQLNFQATDKSVSNYQFGGGPLKQVQALNSLGNYNAFIDNDTLFIKDAFIPLMGPERIISSSTGMIGIPEFTEQGVKVKFLIDNQTTIGSGIEIQSTQYPAANGHYVIYKLDFEVATRDTPFYYIAQAARRR